MTTEEFTCLFEEHSRKIYSFLRKLTESKEDADDLFQETFLTAFEKKAHFDNRFNSGGYLAGIALRLYHNHRKKFFRRQRIAPTKEWEEEETVPSEICLEADVLQKEEREKVRQCVKHLPETYRIMLYLAYTLELSTKEMAGTLHIPEGTVKSRLHKAKQLFKDAWEEEENEQP